MMKLDGMSNYITRQSQMIRVIFAALALLLSACATDTTEDIVINPDRLFASIEEDSRIELSEGKTVWSNGDLISVYNRSDANQQWRYDGPTGERTAELVKVTEPAYTATTNKIYAVYPYSLENFFNAKTGTITAHIPDVQYYKSDSYGVGSSIMVAASQSNNLSFKSVCGWIMLQLTGNGEVVERIELRGNNNEQLSGEVTIDPTAATITLTEGSANTTVTLVCGQEVTLSAEPTKFYIALPPQTLDNGFTATVKCSGYQDMVLKSSKSVTIERNTVQRTKSAQHNSAEGPSGNEIWYTTADGSPANIDWENLSNCGAEYVSNTYQNGKGIITFSGNITSIGWTAFKGCANLKTMTIPQGVKTIANGAFSSSGIEEVVLPSSLHTISISAFYDCKNLETIYLPQNVSRIEAGAFSSCSNLKSVYCAAIQPALIGNGIYNNTHAELKIYVHPLSVNAYKSAWSSYKDKIVADENAPEITETTTISYKSTDNQPIETDHTLVVKSHSYSDGVGTIVIYGKLMSLANPIFADNSRLLSITIPQSVVNIDDTTNLKYCATLKSVIFKSKTVPTIGAALFAKTLCCIYVPATAIDSYKSYNQWNLYADYIFGYNNESEILSYEQTVPSDEIWYVSQYPVTPSSALNIISHKPSTNPTYRGVIKLATEQYISLKRAFISTYIEQITIPSSITWLDNDFKNCIHLHSVNFPNSITSTGNSTFEGCTALKSITIPESITSIDSSAFKGCTALKSITIPESVTFIGSYAFSSCTALTSFTIPNSIERLGEYIFQQCNNLESITLSNRLSYISKKMFAYCSKLKSITIPASVSYVGTSAFTECTSLQSITIPEGVTEIKSEAFAGCTALRSITLPSTITTAESSAFTNCNALKAIYVKDYYTWAAICSPFYGLLSRVGNIYFGGELLEHLVVPNDVTYIEGYMFRGATCLKSVTIPDNVKDIRSYAFKDCTNIKSVNIGNGVTTIGSRAFDNCTKLTDVVIGTGIKSIGSSFMDCTALASFTCKATTPPNLDNIAFKAVSDTSPIEFMIYVPKSAVSAYRNDYYWEKYKVNIVEIGWQPSDNTLLEYTTTDQSKININQNNFGDSIAVMSHTYSNGKGVIKFNGDITKIGALAFYQATKLKTITIPNSVKLIGDKAFYECTNLQRITLPQSVMSIGGRAFYKCTTLTEFTIPNSVTTMGVFVFQGCSNLQSVAVSDNLTTVDVGILADCPKLESMTGTFVKDSRYLIINDTLHAFASSGVTECNIPEGVKSIDNKVCFGYTNIKKVTIPSTVTLINEFAFKDCSALTSVYCKPTTPPTIGGGGKPFNNNASNRKIYVPTASVDTYKSTATWKDYTITGYDY